MYQRDDVSNGDLLYFLNDMANLEVFELHQPCTDNGPKVDNYLHEFIRHVEVVEWPHIHTIKFCGFEIAVEVTVQALANHSDTLRHFHLKNSHFFSPSLKSVLRQFRTELNLEGFHVEGPLGVAPPDGDFHEDTKFCRYLIGQDSHELWYVEGEQWQKGLQKMLNDSVTKQSDEYPASMLRTTIARGSSYLEDAYGSDVED